MKKKTKKKAPAKKKKAAKKIAKKTAKKPAKKSARKAKSSPKKVAAPRVLAVGSPAPRFELLSDTGEKVNLAQFAGKTVVLYFYPKDDTPGCTLESCDFRDNFARVQAQGAIVLGVSKDSVASHVKFKQKYSLPFPLLADTETKVAQAYGVWKEKNLYGKKSMGVERTTFLIQVDSAGEPTIWKVYPKVQVKGHVDQILTDLRGVSG